MASGFGFPMLSSAEIAESVVQFGIAPVANLRPEDIAKPQPDLLPAILARFLASFVDAPGYQTRRRILLLLLLLHSLARSPAWISPRDDDDGQLGFSDLAGLDNPEHHLEAIRVLRLHTKSRAFLDSIQFKDFTLADLLRPTPRRVVEVLSALINFLFYREEKLNLLQPIVNDIPDYHQRTLDLKARIAEVFPACSQFLQLFCSGKCLHA
jgi:kinetochore protein Nuf2